MVRGGMKGGKGKETGQQASSRRREKLIGQRSQTPTCKLKQRPASIDLSRRVKKPPPTLERGRDEQGMEKRTERESGTEGEKNTRVMAVVGAGGRRGEKTSNIERVTFYKTRGFIYLSLIHEIP